MTQTMTPVFAREINDDEFSVETEVVEETESPAVIEEKDQNLTSTINIRCYVDEAISEWDETILFTVYNNTTKEIFNFQLNAINGYYDNINIAPGDCYLYATIVNNDGTYELYCPEQNFEITDSINLICAYGDEDFINFLKPNWDKLEFREMTDLSTLPKYEYTEEVEELEERTVSATVESTETENSIELESNEEKESYFDERKINVPGLILLIIMIIYIGFSINKLRQKKRS